MKTNIWGVGVALVTPFTDEDGIDFAELDKLIEPVIGGGADYLVALGTTAETPALSGSEKEAILRFVVERSAGRVPVIAGLGGNSTADVVSALRSANLDGVDAVLSVTPYYNKPSQEGIYRHYKALAEASPCGIVLYNVPGRTGVNMTAQTVLRLAHDCGNIIGVKEASGNLSQAAYILKDRPEGFAVISGDDSLTVPMAALGGDGIISVAANAFTGKFCRMAHEALDGRFGEASALHMQMIEAIDALFEEGNPVGIKCALSCMGLIRNRLRLPLVRASESLERKMSRLIEENELA